MLCIVIPCRRDGISTPHGPLPLLKTQHWTNFSSLPFLLCSDLFAEKEIPININGPGRIKTLRCWKPRLICRREVFHEMYQNSFIFRNYALLLPKSLLQQVHGNGSNNESLTSIKENQECFQSNPGSSWEEINPLQYSSESFDINDNVNQTTKMGLVS